MINTCNILNSIMLVSLRLMSVVVLVCFAFSATNSPQLHQFLSISAGSAILLWIFCVIVYFMALVINHLKQRL